jgi:hypothetical protein
LEFFSGVACPTWSGVYTDTIFAEENIAVAKLQCGDKNRFAIAE